MSVSYFPPRQRIVGIANACQRLLPWLLRPVHDAAVRAVITAYCRIVEAVIEIVRPSPRPCTQWLAGVSFRQNRIPELWFMMFWHSLAHSENTLLYVCFWSLYLFYHLHSKPARLIVLPRAVTPPLPLFPFLLVNAHICCPGQCLSVYIMSTYIAVQLELQKLLVIVNMHLG